MTAWQTLCARIAADHQPDTAGHCTGCGATYPCARAEMAAPVVSAAYDPLFLAFSVKAAGRCTVVAGRPPRPTPGR